MSMVRAMLQRDVPALPSALREALEASAEDRRCLEGYIVHAEARIDAAIAARTAVPDSDQMLSEAQDAFAEMERVYRDAVSRLLQGADADVHAVVSAITGAR